QTEVAVFTAYEPEE
ncbi:type I toxin-antitoxin system toxin HokD, partial [Escherichia coli]